MPRNYKKELEWEQGKYRQLLFKVGIELAEKHKRHLEAHGIKPIEWFRYAVSLSLVPTEKMTGCAMVGEYDASETGTHGEFIAARLCDTDISNNSLPEGLKITDISILSKCDGIAENNVVAKCEDTDIRVGVERFETAMEVEVQEKVTVLAVEPPSKKRRTQSPTAEMVRGWVEMHKNGMTNAAIAATTESYDVSTVRKRIKKEMAKDDPNTKVV